MAEQNTHQPQSSGLDEPLAALEQMQRELAELAGAMSACQADIDAVVRQPEELARQKAELFDRLQQEHRETAHRRSQLDALEAQVRQKQAALERLQQQIKSPPPEVLLQDGRRFDGVSAEPAHASPSRKPLFVRLVVDLVVLVIVLACGGGYWWVQHQGAEMQREIGQVRQSMREIHNQALLHGSQGDAPVHASGYPLRVDKAWFGALPTNVLTPDDPQWLEVADAAEYARTNPRELVASNGRASFWYNPARGIVRARVPRQLTDASTIDLYNQVNATSLGEGDVMWDGEK